MVGLAPRRFAMLKVAKGTFGSGMAVLPARSGLKMFRVEGRVQNRNMNRSEVLAVKLLHVLFPVPEALSCVWVLHQELRRVAGRSQECKVCSD